MEQVVSPAERHRPLLDELIATVGEHNPDVDRDLLEQAFTFACEAHEGHKRQSGEDFIVHPVGVARILAELRRPTPTVAAALLHDVVEDTDATIEQVRRRVRRRGRPPRRGRHQAHADQVPEPRAGAGRELPQDDRRDGAGSPRSSSSSSPIASTTCGRSSTCGKQKQLQKARETLEVYAPLAHRLGIHQIKWELEDLAFQTLHPRKYQEIAAMVAQRRSRARGVRRRGERLLASELEKAGIRAEISGRAKHFYSIYEKMVKRGKEFNEIYDLTGDARHRGAVGREGQGDCYARARHHPLAVEAACPGASRTTSPCRS